MNLPNSFLGWIVFLIEKYGLLLLKGAGVALIVSLASTIIGFVIGVLVGLVKSIRIENTHSFKKKLLKIVNALLNIYIEVFRGTPSMVQAMVIYYGMYSLGVDIPVLVASICILSVNTGAYMAEIVRGGIESVEKGQKEAAHALGMTHTQSMFLVVLPQAIKNILPSVGNEFIVNIKDTSVFNVISLNELFFMSKSAAGTYFKYFEVFFITAMIYLFMTFSISRLLRIVERKLNGNEYYSLAIKECNDAIDVGGDN